jgi:hypothetical protein
MTKIQVEFKDRTTWEVTGDKVEALPVDDNLYAIYAGGEVISYLNRDEVRQVTITRNYNEG